MEMRDVHFPLFKFTSYNQLIKVPPFSWLFCKWTGILKEVFLYIYQPVTAIYFNIPYFKILNIPPIIMSLVALSLRSNTCRRISPQLPNTFYAQPVLDITARVGQ